MARSYLRSIISNVRDLPRVKLSDTLNLSMHIFIFLFFATSLANANLMLFPTRAIFENNTRAVQIDLTNTGAEPASYRIVLENKRMTEAGKFIPAEPLLPGELTADKLIQYSPRQVELAPGAGQTIRIILRKPADLAPGEYRTHMVFNRLPSAKKIEEALNKDSKDIGIRLTPLIGVSIPIIIQNGETSATASLKNLKFIKAKQNDPAILEVRIERSGNKSLYGDFTVNYTPQDGSEKKLTSVQGVAVYSPYPSRIAKISLQTENKKPLTKGKLTVLFNETRDAGGKLLSEASIDIP